MIFGYKTCFVSHPSLMDELTESALITIAIGLFFFIFGGVFLFDRALMMGGNLILSFGVFLLLKPQLDFNNTEYLKNIGLFIAGTTLVFLKFSFLGMLLQLMAIFTTIKSKIPSLKQIIIRNLTKILRFINFLS